MRFYPKPKGAIMTHKVYNFGAGPAMLPRPVMAQIKEEFLDYQQIGVSVIEMSHRSEEFAKIIREAKEDFRDLAGLPSSYEVIFLAGGARMVFSAICMNLLGRKPARKAQYVVSGTFSGIAYEDAKTYGDVSLLASSKEDGFCRLPRIDVASISQDSSYLHITSNNTIYGTRWHEYPDAGIVPLIVDATSDLLSREIDYSKCGMVYAGFQKNLGPSGMALVAIRKDLLGYAQKETPLLLNFETQVKNNSLTNTTNTFAIYVLGLMLKWLKKEGGVSVMEKRNAKKAKLLYDILDSKDFYKGYADPKHRSHMNVTFNLPNKDLEEAFIKEAAQKGLYALAGHRSVGGIRASIYNAMELSGVEALCDFMHAFEKRH